MSTLTVSPSKSVSLMTIPAEIRLNILTYLLTSDLNIVDLCNNRQMAKKFLGYEFRYTNHRTKLVDVAILRASKQLYREGRPILYQGNGFWFTWVEALKVCPSSLPFGRVELWLDVASSHNFDLDPHEFFAVDSSDDWRALLKEWKTRGFRATDGLTLNILGLESFANHDRLRSGSNLEREIKDAIITEIVHVGIKVEKPQVIGVKDRTFAKMLKDTMRLDMNRSAGVGSEDAAAQTAYLAVRAAE